jgi:carbon-monoxide dehydrogenase small subunit
MSALYLLEKKKQPTREDIRKGIQGNVCRCTGYANIFTAIEAAAQKMRESA